MEPVTDEKRRQARRMALAIRVPVYGFVLVLAVVTVWARTSGSVAKPPPVLEVPRQWRVTALVGKTSQGLPITFYRRADGKLVHFAARWTVTCDFPTDIPQRRLVPMTRQAPAIVERGRGYFTGRDQGAYEEADGLLGLERTDLAGQLGPTEITGELQVVQDWFGSLNKQGRCRTGKVTFRVPLPR
jgi:hypothetical protein